MDEGIEMISEWPVKNTFHHVEFNSKNPDPVPAETVQQQLSHRSAVSDKHISAPGKSSKRNCQYTLTADSSTTSESDHGTPFSSMPSKVPRLSHSNSSTSSFSHLFMDDCNLKNSEVSSDATSRTTDPADGSIKVSDVASERQRRSDHIGGKNVEEISGCGEKDNRSSDACSFQTSELLVMPRIGRWWRRQGHRLVEKEKCLPQTSNPNTLLFHVARLPEGQSFLQGERQRIKRQVQHGDTRGVTMAALASIEDWLGNADAAVQALHCALKSEPHNKEWQWLLHKVRRQQKVKRRQAELMPRVPPLPVFPAAQQVERISCKDLSFAEFFQKYALPRKPVIITDMVETMTTVTWDLNHIREAAGDCEAKVKRSVEGSVEWAGLEESRSVKVSQFLDNLHDCRDYLFDWSLPLHCPRLAQEITIPRYFAGDFLQRTSKGSLYQDSWPSLFVAPPGVDSGLHVDAFASNFWMALFQGKKRWVFFEEEDTSCLYPIYAHSLDPTFEANVSDPDLETHPLLSLVHPKECILNAGEILFVPGGSPHCVQNLDATLAISANFVDLSNFRKVTDELEVNALLDPRADDLLQQFRQPRFPSSMKSDIGDLPWADFKMWPPRGGVADFDITEESVTDGSDCKS